MNHTQISVTRFENRNGATSWRVTGFVHGIRVRKNFKRREEAIAEKGALEIRALQAAAGLRSVATPLTTEQVREAEAVFHRLQGHTRPMSFYVEYALVNYREPEKQKRLADAITEYVAARKHEFEQDQICRPQYDRIRWEMKRLETCFAGKGVAEIPATALVAYLEVGKPEMKTYNNRRGVLSTFFKFAFQRGWIVENPILRVPHYRIRPRRDTVPTLSAAQARALMEYIESYEGGRWVPYFVLCLFAGIRPGVPYGEITKLKPDAVKMNEGFIHVSAEVSKVRKKRDVKFPPNLAPWLTAYPLDKYPIILGNFKKRRQKFAKKLGLTHDIMRHTFISMLVAKTRSLGEAALQAGNSESIIRNHYLDLKSAEEAEEFFNIMPKRIAAKPTETRSVVPYELPSILPLAS